MRKGFTRKIGLNSYARRAGIYSQQLAGSTGKTGLKFENDRALKLLKENGCTVDFDTKIVKFPGWLVEESARRAPSSFSVKATSRKMT